MGTRVEEEEVLLGVVVKVVEGDGVKVEGEREGSGEEGCGCRRGWSLVWDCQKWRGRHHRGRFGGEVWREREGIDECREGERQRERR